MTALLARLGIRWPIIQAPLGGGPGTPELAAEVSAAGGLGTMSAAYYSAAQIDDAAAIIRRLTDQPFAINLFAGGQEPDDAERAAAVAPVLAAFRHELSLPRDPPPAPVTAPFDQQLEAVLRAWPRVLSFTFGMPTREQVQELRAREIVVIGTATTVEEGEALAELGADAICAQGAEAGGHRGTFLGRFEDALVGTMTLVPLLVKRCAIPVIAAGGLMDGHSIRAVLDLGATAAQLGTAFLDCPEAGTRDAHRAALRTATATVITRAFSGRPARGIRNRFTDTFESLAAAPYPQQQRLTHDLRAAAAAAGRTDLMQLWAGQGAPLVRSLPAGDLVRTLVAEAALG